MEEVPPIQIAVRTMAQGKPVGAVIVVTVKDAPVAQATGSYYVRGVPVLLIDELHDDTSTLHQFVVACVTEPPQEPGPAPAPCHTLWQADWLQTLQTTRILLKGNPCERLHMRTTTCLQLSRADRAAQGHGCGQGKTSIKDPEDSGQQTGLDPCGFQSVEQLLGHLGGVAAADPKEILGP